MTAQQVYPLVEVCSHPIIQHNLAIIRDSKTDNEVFRLAIRRISQVLMMEATKNLPQTKSFVETPISKAEVNVLSSEIPLLIAPILRAGLMLSEIALEMLPSASVYHIGLYRDKETHEPITYYNKLPSTIDYSHAQVFLVDPMLATGGSAIAAADILTRLGTKSENMTFVNIISAPEGIENLREHHPDMQIITAAIDERLNDKAYIVPGLGDAGDRAFGTF